MKHAQPYGITIYALAALTLGAMLALAYALDRLRRPRRVRREAAAAPADVHARDTEAYEPPSWTAHREDPS